MINYLPIDLDFDSIDLLTNQVKVRLSELIKDERGLLKTLCLAKQSDTLGAFLKLLGLNSQIEIPSFGRVTASKILVIGESEVKVKDLLGIAKTVFHEHGISFSKERLELHLEYEDCKTYPFEKIRYNDSYCVVFFGPGPHSTESNGVYGSVINRMESEKGFPPVVRLFANGGLKITKTSFRNRLKECITEGLIR